MGLTRVNCMYDYLPHLELFGLSAGTTISPWIVTMEALEPFICEAPEQVGPFLADIIYTFRVIYSV